jgi:hypothetical protein
MKNKKVIVFRKSQWFFPQLIWRNGSFGAPCARPRWVGSARTTIQKKTPFNTLSNEPSFVALSLLITKRLACELLGFQLTQLFPGQD